MSTILRVDASIRPQGSVTRDVTTLLEDALLEDHSGAAVVRRDLGMNPLSPSAWPAAVSAEHAPDADRTIEARGLATELADELIAADAYLFAVPLYNWGVSQHVKNWVDLLLTEERFAPRAEKLIAGRPAYLVTARGGMYAPGSPREGWDHSTPWLQRIFEDVWGLNLQVIEAELTLANVNPAMAGLRDLAAQKLDDAHQSAIGHGKSLAALLRAQAA
ncbi:FMN-dependent NADH-azoreductase [Cryobacterium sp. TMT4-31]|uniref:FMN-dependent NADH-azoreductase n=1 Tax=Cryobacterium sp. TMT4-31 TaxID=1259259 RepID=UPI001068E88B|nr:NAD(P)H-dependent oxidoreductase [Cryobacterium sp. TMT4-31]TFC90369.1 flavodoxin family protein [Cryobacterium sp. TMT4-31]